MPTAHIDYINERCIDTFCRILNIPKIRCNDLQLLLFVGRMPAKYHVNKLKMLHLKKLEDNYVNGSSLLHKWMGPTVNQMRTPKVIELVALRKKYVGNYLLDYGGKNGANRMKNDIIANMMTELHSKLPTMHPIRVIGLSRHGLQPFFKTDFEDLKKHSDDIKKSQKNKYYRIGILNLAIIALCALNVMLNKWITTL